MEEIKFNDVLTIGFIWYPSTAVSKYYKICKKYGSDKEYNYYVCFDDVDDIYIFRSKRNRKYKIYVCKHCGEQLKESEMPTYCFLCGRYTDKEDCLKYVELSE